MSSGGGSEVKYSSSPEQRQIMQALMPLLQGQGQYGQERYFGGQPQQGAPSAAGRFTDQQMYDIPDPTMAMPTAQWYNSIAPEVKAGLYAPYVEAGQALQEQMGSRGQMGSAGSFHTGAYGAAAGELAGNAAQNVGMQAWNMTSPMAINAWNANLQRNQQAYGAGQQERLGDYNTQMEVWRRPMQAMGMMNQGMPQGYSQQQSNQTGGAMSGAMQGGMAGGMIGGPWGAGIGAVGGGLAGWFS
jgi:hypothetical protein